ncbi:MAG: hypothetical protein AAF228_04085 [Pseudomonadota bacterium]
MIRILLIALFSFLLPFFVYAITYSFFLQEKIKPGDTIWTNAPYPLLSAIGSILAVFSIMGLVLWSGGRL